MNHCLGGKKPFSLVQQYLVNRRAAVTPDVADDEEDEDGITHRSRL